MEMGSKFYGATKKSIRPTVEFKTFDCPTFLYPAGTKVTRPIGGFILWVELPKTVNAMQLYQRALDAKISIVPGRVFSAKQHYQNFIRLSCGHPWSVELEQALATLGRLAKEF
jgi:DNA-binding transcriptional MocR family regulator